MGDGQAYAPRVILGAGRFSADALLPLHSCSLDHSLTASGNPRAPRLSSCGHGGVLSHVVSISSDNRGEAVSVDVRVFGR